jgi:hypothetical protein
MKPATISELKSALSLLNQKELIAVCAKMASFRKENKALLTYLLFEADDQAMFIKNVKEEMVAQVFCPWHLPICTWQKRPIAKH